VGSHLVTAVYGGDAGNAGSSSDVLTQVVNKPGAPSVSITRPASGASYRFGQLVRASYHCSEGTNGPGIVSCKGPVASGSPIDAHRVGTHTFTVTAVSGDGTSVRGSVVYRIQRPRLAVSRKKTSADGTVRMDLTLSGPGIVNVLETAPKDNFASAAAGLQPGRRSFVFARKHIVVTRAGTIRVTVKPNKRGMQLVAHHHYRVTIRLWISYKPAGGRQRNMGPYRLQFPSH
jgi:hypothetical protein